MATDARTINFASGSDELFRGWGGAISAALQAVGLVKTNDSGQIDWTSAVRANNPNSATEQNQGYEIFRFSDELHNFQPIFIKIEYLIVYDYNSSLAQGQPTAPGIIATVGSATDGAGSLVGPVTSTRTRVCGGAPYTIGSSVMLAPSTDESVQCYFSGDGSYVVMVLGAQSEPQPIFNGVHGSYPKHSSFPAMMVVDRMRGPDGNPSEEGALFFTSYWYTSSTTAPTSVSAWYQALSHVNNAVSTRDSRGWPGTWPGEAFQSGSDGSALYVYPMSVNSPGPCHMLALQGIYKGDVALGAEIDIFTLGAMHRYKSMAGISGTSTGDKARSSVSLHVPSSAVLVRWE